MLATRHTHMEIFSQGLLATPLAFHPSNPKLNILYSNLLNSMALPHKFIKKLMNNILN